MFLLDFEKAFDRIEWGFFFTALSKLSFNNTRVNWVRALYHSTSSAIKVNRVIGPDFHLAHFVRQGCPLAPYLFILATDIVRHMMEDPKYGVDYTYQKEVASGIKPSQMTPRSTSKAPQPIWTKLKTSSSSFAKHPGQK